MENKNANTEEVNNMIHVKTIIERIPEEDQSIEYKNIAQLIHDFLHSKCQHSIIMDNVDITPDKSEQIFYCRWCLETF
jgi:hypothetical protein